MRRKLARGRRLAWTFTPSASSDMLADAKNELASELGPVIGKARSLKEDLPDPPRGREDEGTAFREEARPGTGTELVVSDDLNPPQ